MKKLTKNLKKSSVFQVLRNYKKKKDLQNPEEFTRKQYGKFYNRELNLKNPLLLSEKIQYLKLYDYPNNNKVIQSADKYTLRNYLATKNMNHLSVPFLEIFGKDDFININHLPNAFVLKKTNASGFNLIVKDKKKVTNKQIANVTKKWFNKDFGENSIELHYSKSTDNVICEPFFEHLGNEYRLFMVEGEVGFVQVIAWDWSESENENINCHTIEGHGKHYRLHYDMSWKLLWKDNDTPNIFIDRPSYFEEMKKISEIIGQDFPVVRIDFNEINNKLKITELTFTPSSGFLDILKQVPELDKKLGRKLKLEKKIEKNS